VIELKKSAAEGARKRQKIKRPCNETKCTYSNNYCKEYTVCCISTVLSIHITIVSFAVFSVKMTLKNIHIWNVFLPLFWLTRVFCLDSTVFKNSEQYVNHYYSEPVIPGAYLVIFFFWRGEGISFLKNHPKNTVEILQNSKIVFLILFKNITSSTFPFCFFYFFTRSFFKQFGKIHLLPREFANVRP
jgi:hypothetical protein